MKVYHGSPQLHDSIDPALDDRTGIRGIWLTSIEEYARIYACIIDSDAADIEWHSSGDTFVRAHVTTAKSNVTERGWLYVFEIDTEKLVKHANHVYFYDGTLKTDQAVEVAKDELISVEFTYRNAKAEPPGDA